MLGRYRGGVVPADPGGDADVAAEVGAAVEATTAAYERLDISRAVEECWRLVRRLNRLVEQRAPWALAKDPARAGELDQTLFSLADGLRAAAILLWPVIPSSSERILAALGQDPASTSLEAAAWGAGRPGAQVRPEGPLFPRVEEKVA
jgi:methionyl-tRNA synthetase